MLERLCQIMVDVDEVRVLIGTNNDVFAAAQAQIESIYNDVDRLLSCLCD